MLEMSKLLPRIVNDFDFELVGDNSNNVSRLTTRNYWFVKPTNFRVRIMRRKI
jgi:hypothetical protein